MTEDEELESRTVELLRDPDADAPALRAALQTLFDRCRTQQRLLDRLVQLSDGYQNAERQRGLSFAQRYERKLRQLERIVRISDRYQSMLQDLNERLSHVATHDALTGLPNRRHMQERLDTEMSRATRKGEGFSVAMADIDHFKRINDQHGHAVGDATLSRLARVLADSLREYDLCARWGGEEFLLLFVGVSFDEALRLAERIRLRVAEPPADGAPAVTVSIGVTDFCPGDTRDSLLQRADAALYRAKDAGRDRVLGQRR